MYHMYSALCHNIGLCIHTVTIPFPTPTPHKMVQWTELTNVRGIPTAVNTIAMIQTTPTTVPATPATSSTTIGRTALVYTFCA